jgi:GT2 family glycosyltransferase
MLLSIVIVNFNAGDLILTCIASILNETQLVHYEIIVVDNDSSDNSIEQIRQHFPVVKIIETGINLGFATANNLGFKQAKGEYILVLNPDTLIINHAIDKAVTYLSTRPEVGILGCQVLSATGKISPTLMKFLTLSHILINIFIPLRIMLKSRRLGRSHYTGLDYTIEQDVEVVVGCFMMLPQVLIDEIGGFDEDFFMFVEEVEWCWRVIQTGKKVRYYPGSSIIHYEGGCSGSLAYRKILLTTQGALLFFKKTRGTFVATVANILMILRDSPRAFIWLLLQLFSSKIITKGLFFKKFYIRLIYLLRYLIKCEQKI